MKRTKSTEKVEFFAHNENFRVLFKSLPLGSARKIQLRLAKRKPKSKSFSISYINSVLNPDDKRWNLEIIKECISLLKDLKIEKATLKNEVDEFIDQN